MAKNISATALADGCIALLAVEDDPTPIVKEFVTAAVNSNMTIHPSMTYGSGTWKGQLRSTWIHGVDGLDNHGITFDPANLPPGATYQSSGVTCVLILKALTSAALNKAEIWRINAANTTFKFDTSDQFGWGQDAGGLWYQSDYVVPTGTQVMIAGYWRSGGASSPKIGRLYYGLESAADMTLDKETTSAINAGPEDEPYLGAMGVDGSGIVDAEVYYLAAFNGELDIAKLNTIHDDPEAYFFEAAGTTPVQWDGPDIGDQVWTEGVAITPPIDVSTGFSGSETPFSYADAPTYSLPAGVSINPTTGVISGTPATTQAATGYAARATDQTPDTADTNVFNITVNAPQVDPTITVPEITDANENPAAGISGCILKCRDTTDDSVLTFDNLTTAADGTITLSHPSLTASREYDVVYEVPTLPNRIRGVRLITTT